ncbi:MAG: hypothetical protein JJ863_25750 [Deltaproteobacteria bacterium]|nr:hypothetical protein [Deltaproteobacteria bacterium]
MRASLCVLSLLLGCASNPPPTSTAVRGLRAPDDAAVRRQLAGHLPRIRECLPVGRSGLIDFELTVLPDGSVANAKVTRDTSMLRKVTPCMRHRLAALRFDPPPSSATRFRHRFTACALGTDLACELGPVVDPEGRRVRPSLEEGLRSLHDRRAECLARHPEERAILDVEVAVDGQGKVMSGTVLRVEPAGSPLRECAVGPLLGAELDEVRDARLRATVGVGLAAAESSTWAGRPRASR